MLIPVMALLSLAAAPKTAAAEEAAALPTFQEVCLEEFDQHSAYPGQDYLKRILGQVPGHEYRMSGGQFYDRHACQINGLFRIQQPWQAGSAMRLSILTYKTLRLYFWRGDQGVAMVYYPNWYQQWAAYGTTRTGNKPKPDTYAFWATDSGRFQQSGAGTVLLLYQDDHLYLTRGDLLLMAVPLEKPPTEVFLETEGMVWGLQFLRCRGGPGVPQPRPTVAKLGKPAEANWNLRTVEGITLGKLPDGRVELAAKERTQAGQAGVTLCKPGLHEFLFEIEDAAIGTGVYLGDAQGNQVYRLGILRESTSQRPVLCLLDPTNGSVEQWGDFNGAASPYAGKRQWVQLVAGAGVWRFSVSGDGVHWSPANTVATVQRAVPTQVGLYCIPSDKARSIRLRSVEVRRLDGLSSTAPAAVVERVPQEVSRLKTVPGAAPGGAPQPAVPLEKAGSLEQWLPVALASRPADVTPEVWQRACILHTLMQSTSQPLCQLLLFRLLDDFVAGPAEPALKVQALEEAALLVNPQDGNSANQLGDCYGRLGQSLLRQGDPVPLSTVSAGLLRAALAQRMAGRVAWDDLLTAELFPLLYQGRWRQVDELCRRIRLWQEPRRLMNNLPPDEAPLAELADWARTKIPRRTSPPQAERPGAGIFWRPLLSPSLSKEGYNALAEVDAALRGQAYGEACQAITATANPLALGIVPDARDRRLLATYPVAIRLMMDREPALRKAMAEGYLRIGRLRLQTATSNGDESAVETAAVLFVGTEVAVEAHRWLGDRALSAGRFVDAIGRYKQALYGASPAQRQAVAARARLAAALLGRDLASPVTQPVRIGDTQFSAQEFERLVAELRQARGGPDSAGYYADRVQTSPPPGRYQAKPFARIPGDGVAPPPGLPTPESDWGARQMAVAMTPQQMIMHNRAWLVVCNLADGRVLMERQLQGEASGQQAWPLVPMRPVLSGSRIFVRWLTRDGPMLGCFEAGTGRELWRFDPQEGAPGCAVCDPLLSGPDLFVLTIRSVYPQKLLLLLSRIDPASGEVLSQAPLAEFFDQWHRVLPCQATAIDGSIVATLGGCVVCCEQSGRVQWLRQQLWIPPKDRAETTRPWYAQVHDPPLVAKERIYAMQPGMRSIECLDLATGRLLWQQTIPRLLRVVGLAGERLVVGTTSEVLGLDAASGKVLWRHDAPDRLEALLCGRPGGVCLVQLQRHNDPNAPRRPVLVWLDAETGRQSGETILEVAPQVKPMFGPLVAQGNRQWLMFAMPQSPATRQVWELVPEK